MYMLIHIRELNKKKINALSFILSSLFYYSLISSSKRRAEVSLSDRNMSVVVAVVVVVNILHFCLLLQTTGPISTKHGSKHT